MCSTQERPLERLSDLQQFIKEKISLFCLIKYFKDKALEPANDSFKDFKFQPHSAYKEI